MVRPSFGERSKAASQHPGLTFTGVSLAERSSVFSCTQGGGRGSPAASAPHAAAAASAFYRSASAASSAGSRWEPLGAAVPEHTRWDRDRDRERGRGRVPFSGIFDAAVSVRPRLALCPPTRSSASAGRPGQDPPPEGRTQPATPRPRPVTLLAAGPPEPRGGWFSGRCESLELRSQRRTRVEVGLHEPHPGARPLRWPQEAHQKGPEGCSGPDRAYSRSSLRRRHAAAAGLAALLALGAPLPWRLCRGGLGHGGGGGKGLQAGLHLLQAAQRGGQLGHGGVVLPAQRRGRLCAHLHLQQRPHHRARAVHGAHRLERQQEEQRHPGRLHLPVQRHLQRLGHLQLLLQTHPLLQELRVQHRGREAGAPDRGGQGHQGNGFHRVRGDDVRVHHRPPGLAAHRDDLLLQEDRCSRRRGAPGGSKRRVPGHRLGEQGQLCRSPGWRIVTAPPWPEDLL